MNCKYCGNPLKAQRKDAKCCSRRECLAQKYRERQGHKAMITVNCGRCGNEFMGRDSGKAHFCRNCRAKLGKRLLGMTNSGIMDQIARNAQWQLPSPSQKQVHRAESRGAKLRVTIYKQWEREARQAGKKISTFMDKLHLESELPVYNTRPESLP